MRQQINSFKSLKDFEKSNLQALTNIHLQLKNFDFNSEQLDALNASLKQCCKLEHLALDLYNNQSYSNTYEQQELPTKPKKREQRKILRDFLQYDTISNLANLKRLELNLSGNSINDTDAFTISTVIGRFKKLTNLNLQFWNNAISDIGISNIAVGISYCFNLTVLTLNIG
ncbi:hypothetical protein ABPG73_006515, partial [Tetrahymena malaccensis]